MLVNLMQYLTQLHSAWLACHKALPLFGCFADVKSRGLKINMHPMVSGYINPKATVTTTVNAILMISSDGQLGEML